MYQIRDFMLDVWPLNTDYWQNHDVILEKTERATYIKVAGLGGGLGSGLMRNSSAKREFIARVLETFEKEISTLQAQILKGNAVDKIEVNTMDVSVKELILKLTGGARSSHYFRGYEKLHKKLVEMRNLAQITSFITPWMGSSIVELRVSA